MKNELDISRMTRQVYNIPDYVVAALVENALWDLKDIPTPIDL